MAVTSAAAIDAILAARCAVRLRVLPFDQHDAA
jgi:hypothetical protein